MQHLVEMGSDINQLHGFDFYMYLPTEAAAREVGAKAEEKKMGITILPAASGSKWLCKATFRIVPEKACLDEIGNFFRQASDVYHGEFDGWESDIIKPSSRV